MDLGALEILAKSGIRQKPDNNQTKSDNRTRQNQTMTGQNQTISKINCIYFVITEISQPRVWGQDENRLGQGHYFLIGQRDKAIIARDKVSITGFM